MDDPFSCLCGLQSSHNKVWHVWIVLLYNLDLKFAAFCSIDILVIFEMKWSHWKAKASKIRNWKLTYLGFKYLVSFYSYVFLQRDEDKPERCEGDIHKTTYELLTINIFAVAPYPKRYHDLLGESFVLKAPLQ